MQYSSSLKVLTCLKSYKRAMRIIFSIQRVLKDPWKYFLERVDNVEDTKECYSEDKDEETLTIK